MIPLDPQHGFHVYLVVWFIILGILWGRELWRGNLHDWTFSRDRFCICEHCHQVFSVKPHVNITRCPSCNEMCVLRSRQRWF